MIKVYRLFFFIVLGVVNFPSKAQDQKLIDSLTVYLNGPDNETKLNAISDLAWEYNRFNLKKAITLSKQAVKIAQKLDLKANLSQAYEDLGTSYYYRRDFDSSAWFYKASEEIARELNDSMGLASLYNKMGALYQERGEYEVALKYSFASLNIYQKKQNIHKIALLLNNIGVTYEALKNYDQAMSYYQQAIAFNEKENDITGKARNYLGLGNVNTALNRLSEALDYYRKAETIFREQQWMLELSVALNNIGNVLDEQGKYEESVKKRTEALEIMIMAEDVFEAAKYHCYISGTLMKAGKFNEARGHIESAMKFSEDIRSPEISMEIYEAWAKYYFGTGKFVPGNQYLVKFHQIKDSLYSAELSKNIANLEVEKNTSQLRIEKAESEARSLKLEKEKKAAEVRLNYTLLISGCSLVVVALFFFLYLQKRKQNEEKKRIQSMLMSEEKERTRIARELHDGLGQLLSTVKLSASSVSENLDGEDHEVLENSLRLVDDAIIEVRHISHNLMPVVLEQKGLVPAIENLAKSIEQSKRIQVSFIHTGTLQRVDKNISISIYRIVQETLNNMIRHSEANHISIHISFQPRTILLHISDNGIGFNTKKIQDSDGMGWNNIFTRTRLLNGTCEVTSREQQGTNVSITLNL